MASPYHSKALLPECTHSMFLPFREYLENNGKLFIIVITENVMVNINIRSGSQEPECLMNPNGSLSKLDISHNLLSAFSASVPDTNTLYK